MKVFRRDIEVALKTVGALTLLALIVVPLAWGYEQGRQARTWQSVACTYRVNEITRRGALTVEAEPGADACTVLARLGIRMQPDELSAPVAFAVRRVTTRNSVQ